MIYLNTYQRSPGDGSAPYWSLWAATFLGFVAIGMTIQVMPAFEIGRAHV